MFCFLGGFLPKNQVYQFFTNFSFQIDKPGFSTKKSGLLLVYQKSKHKNKTKTKQNKALLLYESINLVFQFEKPDLANSINQVSDESNF